MQPSQDLPTDSLYQAMRRISRVLARPARASVTSIGLVILIALLDFATGYEMRLAMLYTIPIALATWVGGARPGSLAAIAAVACWGIGFHPTHVYSDPLYYYWEATMLMMTFAIFILLLHSLRSALARADRRLLHVLDGLPTGIFVTDQKNGNLLYANRHFTQLVGEPVQEHAAQFEQRLLAQLSAPVQPDAAFQYSEVRDEETGRWYLVQTGPIQWEDDRPVQLKVLMDVTDSKQAEALRQQHQELLHNSASNAVLAEIATTLGHELNQPLMAIAAYLDASTMLLAKDRPDLKEVIAALHRSRAQVSRASDILERTRSFLRRRAPCFMETNLNEVAQEAAQALELEIQEANIQLDLQLGDKLPGVTFDSTLVQQVILNLLRNAIEALLDKKHPRHIQLRTQPSESQGLMLSISDNGSGVAEDMVDRLFTPFATTKSQGLGLGLCICRSIIEAHGGHLWHVNGENGGASFYFTLEKGRQHADFEA